MGKDNLGDRMKSYESVSSSILTPRIPAIIRVDGRAFHTFTRKFDYPFDVYLSQCMQLTALHLSLDISTACLTYGQSDEISILLLDNTTLQTEQWFGGKVQKMVSIAASRATLLFNQLFRNHLETLKGPYRPINMSIEEANERYERLKDRLDTAMFDARVFSIPEEDVSNYFYWRWKDATRNSLLMAARKHFSHQELEGKKMAQIKDMLRYKANDPWEDMPGKFKDGWLIEKPCRVANEVKKDIREIVARQINQERRRYEQ